MQVPLEIRYHQLDPSPALDEEIRTHVDKLERLYPRLTACRVAVECLHHQHQTGNVIEVHIELAVPGRTLVVSREPHKPHQEFAHPDVRASLKQAFKAAERQLKDYKEQQKGEVKSHPTPMYATVTQLVPEEDHGFLMTTTGALLYFNRTSCMTENFDSLRYGDSVHYIQVEGDNGPVASKVWKAKAEAAE